MAYFRRMKAGGWRAEVARRGVRRSAVFATKAAAQQWAAQQEAEILAGARGEVPRRTLAQALERHINEVTVRRRTARADLLRFAAFVRDFPQLAGKWLVDVSAADLAAWRDARLARVAPAASARR